jgi:hypothetical protein
LSPTGIVTSRGDRKGPDTPGFVQIMEVKTSRLDDVQAFMDKMEAENGEAMASSWRS